MQNALRFVAEKVRNNYQEVIDCTLENSHSTFSAGLTHRLKQLYSGTKSAVFHAALKNVFNQPDFTKKLKSEYPLIDSNLTDFDNFEKNN